MILWSLQLHRHSGAKNLRGGHWGPLGSRWWFGISGNTKGCATERTREPLTVILLFCSSIPVKFCAYFLITDPWPRQLLQAGVRGRQAGLSRLQLWPWAHLPSVTVKENISNLNNVVLLLSWWILSLCESRGCGTIWHRLTLLTWTPGSFIIITAKHERGEKITTKPSSLDKFYL